MLLTPAHQCPTGAVLSPARRHELVQWAHDVDGVILEDDYDAEFRYDRQPVGSLQGLAPGPRHRAGLGQQDPRARTAHRLGLRAAAVPSTPSGPRSTCPAEESPSSTRQRWRDSSRPVVSTGTCAGCATEYRRRRDALVDAVTEHLAGATISGLDAGQHLLLRLPAGVDEQRFVVRANAAGIAVRGLGDYRVTPDDAASGAPVPPALVIGFGNVSTDRIRDGIGVLGRLASG